MTATNVVDMTLHRAYLEYRTESASNDVAEHVNGCNQCWSAIHMPGPGRLCDEGAELADRYEEVADRG